MDIDASIGIGYHKLTIVEALESNYIFVGRTPMDYSVVIFIYVYFDFVGYFFVVKYTFVLALLKFLVLDAMQQGFKGE